MFRNTIILIFIDIILFLAVLLLSFLIFAKIYEKPKSAIMENSIGNLVSPTPTVIQNNDKTGVDLSYIEATIDKENSLKLLDATNKTVGSSHIEEPIADPSGKMVNTVGALSILEYAKPKTGSYTLIVNGKGNATLDIYIYDKGAGKKLQTLKNINSGDSISIQFDKDDVNNSTIEIKN